MKKLVNFMLFADAPSTLEEKLLLAKRYGYDGIECSPEEILCLKAEHIQKIIQDAGIPIASCVMPFLPVEEEAGSYQKKLAEFAKTAAIMGKVGVKLCTSFVRSSSDHYRYEENYRLHVERWKPIAALLNNHGIRLSLEFLGPKTTQEKRKYPFIRTAQQLLPLCMDIGDHVGITFDFWHWYSGGGDRSVFEDIGGTEHIYCVHLNDAYAKAADTLPDKPRRLAGTSKVIDTAFLVESLRRCHYQGYVLSESFDEVLKGRALEENLQTVRTVMRNVLQE